MKASAALVRGAFGFLLGLLTRLWVLTLRVRLVVHREKCHVREAAQERDVEETVVYRTITADEAAAVHVEPDRQAL